MKLKHYILIALALVFNDFVGSLIVAAGLLILKLGNLLASIPTFI